MVCRFKLTIKSARPVILSFHNVRMHDSLPLNFRSFILEHIAPTKCCAQFLKFLVINSQIVMLFDLTDNLRL